MARRDRIIMMKRDTPKRVTLPNGGTFVARYKRITRNHLPENVRLRRPYRQRAVPRGRCCHQIAVQQGGSIGSNILNFARRLLKH